MNFPSFENFTTRPLLFATCPSATKVVPFGATTSRCPVANAPTPPKLNVHPVGASNTFRENATVHRGTQPGSETIIGSDCFIMACAHVAHNCRLGDRVIVANNVALAGHVEINDGAFISGGVVVHQFCRLGRLAMIGGNAKIVQDCLPFVVTDGVPGRAHGLNLIGLRRAGFKSSEIQKLKEAYRLLLRSGLGLEAALARMGELLTVTNTAAVCT